MKAGRLVGVSGPLLAVTLFLAFGCEPGVDRVPRGHAEGPIDQEIFVPDLPKLTLRHRSSIGPGSEIGRELAGVDDARFLSDSTIAFADSRGSQVGGSGLDGAGSWWLRRPGRGPGEFVSVRGVWPTKSGGFLLWDDLQGRLLRFDSEQHFEGQASLAPELTAQRQQAFVGVLENGSVPLARPPGILGLRDRAAGAGVFLDSLEIVLFDSRGSSLGSLSTRGTERAQVLVDGGKIYIRPMFGNERLFAVTASSLWLLDTAYGLLTRMNPSGDIVWRGRLSGMRSKTNPSDREAFLDRTFGDQVRVGVANRFEQAWRSVEVRDSLPTASVLRGASDGSVWVGLYTRPDEPSRTWVHISDSGVAWTTTLPSPVEVMDARNGLVATVSFDELDRPTLDVWILDGPPS